MYASLKNILFPIKCVHCKAVGKYLCLDCAAKIRFLDKQYCPGCAKASVLGLRNHGCVKRTELDQLISLVFYEGSVRSLIMQYKYAYVTELREVFKWLITRAIEPDIFSPNAILVPIPLHDKRSKERGFNQAEVLASILSRFMSLPVETNLIVRVKNTAKQSNQLTLGDRRANIRGAFNIIGGKHQYKGYEYIVLVDDVYTSGNTLNEAARTIRKILPSSFITGFTLARG